MLRGPRNHSKTAARVYTAHRSRFSVCRHTAATYQAECIRTTVLHDGPYKTLAHGELVTAGWVDCYNTRRLHRSLGVVTRGEHDQAHYADRNREPRPVFERNET
jgi:hypothetical protein